MNSMSAIDDRGVQRQGAARQASVKTLWHAFDEIAAKYPHRVAVTFGDRQLSYCEIQERASRLARRLRSLGVGPESLVGIYLERSPWAIIALLGTVKAGGAYLPLDPSYPSDRLAMIVDDAQPKVLLTQEALLSRVPAMTQHVVCLDRDDTPETLFEGEQTDPGSGPESLAYVIYTSGSTGKPKGVMVTHANVVRLLTATEQWFRFNEEDVWTLFHSLAFDFSVWEIWGCLLHGGRLVIVPFAVSRSPEEFHELLVKERVTVLNQTPSAFYQLMAAEQSQHLPPMALRVVVFGGEMLNFNALKPWFARHGERQPRLINMYGITETTVHVTYRELTAADASENTGSLIGVPIPDLRLHLLDEDRKPVADGEVGEIYVAGAGVARGYLNRPELNAVRFIPDTFSGIPGSRLYKSGDLARFRLDGELEYLGRADTQVKIQGFRIELGEVEAALLGHPEIRETRVVTHADGAGTKRLLAYYVERPGTRIHARELSEYLSGKLPPWMMPSAYLPVAAFPLTTNGKVDVSALPKPIFGSAGDGPVEEVSEMEHKVSAVWRAVLAADHLRLDDNFFDIGGTSLLLVSMHTRLQALLGRRIPIADLFACTTVRTLSRKLAGSESESVARESVKANAQKQRATFARARARAADANRK